MVDISDALSERDRVKFTVHTKVRTFELLHANFPCWFTSFIDGCLTVICASFQTTLPNFKEGEFSVVREHEEFVWLHDRYVENEEYAGIIVSIVEIFVDGILIDFWLISKLNVSENFSCRFKH